MVQQHNTTLPEVTERTVQRAGLPRLPWHLPPMGPRGGLLGLLRRCARGACVAIPASTPGLSGGPEADSLQAMGARAHG